MSMGVFLEFIKWLNISGSFYVKTNHALMMNLTADTIAGVIIAIIGVNLMKSGTFDRMTNSLGNQIDELLLKRYEKK